MRRLSDPDFADFVDETGWESSTVAVAVAVLEGWLTWCAAEGIEATEASRRDIVNWLTVRRDQGRAPATRRKEWWLLERFYRWASTPQRDGGGGLRDDNPMIGVRRPKISDRPSTKAATGDMVATLLDACDPRTLDGRRDAAIVSLMFRAGARVGELPAIAIGDIRPWRDGRVIRLHGADTKSGEERELPVFHAETSRLLDRYLKTRRARLGAVGLDADTGPLFVKTRPLGDPMSRATIQSAFKRLEARTGLDVSPHQLRRGWTAESVRHGVDTVALEVVGGWADHRMPRRYMADQERQAALDRYWQVTADTDAAAGRRPRRRLG